MFFAASLLGPFALAALLGALLLPTARRWNLLLAVGCLLGLGLALYLYLSAPLEQEYASASCAACGQYLGRWWQPGLVALLVGVGYLAWILGLAAGGTIRSLVRPRAVGAPQRSNGQLVARFGRATR